MPNQDDQFIEKEVVLKVDQDEILIPDCDLPTIVKARALPNDWQWHRYEDGSGHLQAPDGETYFPYDLGPYAFQGGIEYKQPHSMQWDIFWGSFEEFTAFAEKQVAQELFRPLSSFGEHLLSPDKQLPLDEIVRDAETRRTGQPFTPQSKMPDHEY